MRLKATPENLAVAVLRDAVGDKEYDDPDGFYADGLDEGDGTVVIGMDLAFPYLLDRRGWKGKG